MERDTVSAGGRRRERASTETNERGFDSSRGKNVRTRTGRTNYFDYSLLIVVIFLVCFGFLMLYSASSYSSMVNAGDTTYYLKRQLLSTGFGAIAMLFCMIVVKDYRWWQKYVKFWYFGSLIFVALVLTPLGMNLNGARRWLNFKVTTIQPAESVKMAIIITVAHLISQNYKHLDDWRVLLKILGYALIGSGAVAVITSNLSTAIIIFGIAVVMVFVASPKYRMFVFIGVGAVALIAVFLIVGKLSGQAFRISRIMVWLKPEDYAAEGGYQVLQGLYAIGSGGLFGKGLGQSVQKLGFIPEAQNDYIFTIICEELGIVGAISVILLFAFIIIRMAFIASNAPDLFGSMLVVGVMAHISLQVILNIAVVTNSIPNTGVTLPFISYGGTSVMFLMSEVGIVLAVSRSIKRRR